MNDAEQTIKSPCIRHCCLDADDVCVGCYRTIQEIMDWHKSTESQKHDILNQCLIRKNQRPPR
ncbi:DUF1289 domain-containing protein [Marinomonas profundimaris]|uniref:Fe-S protein n=1 Tax=Marinomonas profundimaris TaxID=1208321 RepID=W1RYR3_9GAMM|nr:DUF1289 domain-containing protein [Marinomonas profundimaris]ETI62326.1 hypothetical protein D104_00840 [Marinomonas profundimaris]